MSESVLQFWFHGPGKGKHYWAGGAEQQKELDDLIRSEHGERVEAAAAGALTQEWSRTARGSLALIILLDQWSRNIYRDTPKAFAQDSLAQQVCVDGIARGQHMELSDEPTDSTGSSMRQMFLIPLFHAERVELLARGLELLPLAKYTWGIEQYTKKRIAEVEQFGRVPSRNKAKGLESTPEERAAGY